MTARLPVTAPRRPVLRYFGGKFRLRSWVLSFLPPHRIYVEPFGGAASVLLAKPRAYAEVYKRPGRRGGEPVPGAAGSTGALADGARKRTEVLWLNPAASAALRASRAQLVLA